MSITQLTSRDAEPGSRERAARERLVALRTAARPDPPPGGAGPVFGDPPPAAPGPPAASPPAVPGPGHPSAARPGPPPTRSDPATGRPVREPVSAAAPERRSAAPERDGQSLDAIWADPFGDSDPVGPAGRPDRAASGFPRVRLGGAARAGGRPVAVVETTAPLPIVGRAAGRVGRALERWLPRSWRQARVDPGRRGSLALVAVAGVAAVVAAVGVWRDRPVAEAAPPLAVLAAPAAEAGPAPAGSAPAPKGGPLVVSVAGKVRRPGLVTVPDGARVADAIAAAGGPLPRTDLTPLNLARRVTDGEQVLVGQAAAPATEAPTVGGGAGAAGPGPGSGKVDLNRATLEQLDTLPGVGPVTAQRILDWRAAHGRFTSVDQLREIEGIGERRFGQLRGQVTV